MRRTEPSADRGQHRGANVPDLVVATAAGRAGLAVLHYEADFDLIATSPSRRWVVPRGSHLATLRDRIGGERFVRDVVLYTGGERFPCDERPGAWPLATLWAG